MGSSDTSFSRPWVGFCSFCTKPLRHARAVGPGDIQGKTGGVPSRTLDLVHLRGSQINGCSLSFTCIVALERFRII